MAYFRTDSFKGKVLNWEEIHEIAKGVLQDDYQRTLSRIKEMEEEKYKNLPAEQIRKKVDEHMMGINPPRYTGISGMKEHAPGCICYWCTIDVVIYHISKKKDCKERGCDLSDHSMEIHNVQFWPIPDINMNIVVKADMSGH